MCTFRLSLPRWQFLARKKKIKLLQPFSLWKWYKTQVKDKVKKKSRYFTIHIKLDQEAWLCISTIRWLSRLWSQKHILNRFGAQMDSICSAKPWWNILIGTVVWWVQYHGRPPDFCHLGAHLYSFSLIVDLESCMEGLILIPAQFLALRPQLSVLVGCLGLS